MKIKFTFFLLTLTLISSTGKEKNLSADKAGQIIASVGSHQISLEQFAERYSNYLFYSGAKDNIMVRQSILGIMITELLLRHYDDNQNIFSDPEYKKDQEWIKNEAILTFLKEREIYAKISVSDEELRDVFIKVSQKIAARHLYAETEEQANNLYELLKIGVDFGYLARQTFTDSVLKNNGGYLGYFSWSDMDPAFEAAAYTMKVGEISKPVKTAHGYSIIKIEDKITNPILTENEFLNKKEQLTRLIKIQKMRPAENEYLKKLVNLDKIYFNDGAINKLLSALGNESNYTEESEKGKNNLNPDENCAEYNDVNYKVSDVLKWIYELPSYHKEKIKTPENLKSVIKGFIVQEKLLTIAEKKGYYKNPVVLETLSKMDNNLFLKYKKKKITDGYAVPDSEALNFYGKNIDLFSSEKKLNVQEIILNNLDTASSVLERLKNDEDFGMLAETYSLRKWSSQNSGEMGFAPASKYGMLKDTLWNSEIGRLVGPLKIQDFYGIFKVLGKIDQRPFGFNEVKEKVISAVKLENEKKITGSYLKEIQKKVNIEINNELLKTYSIAS